jgi:hypothetical protein
MITNKMFRWFVIKDNFLDKQACEELIKYCNERENKSTMFGNYFNIYSYEE